MLRWVGSLANRRYDGCGTSARAAVPNQDGQGSGAGSAPKRKGETSADPADSLGWWSDGRKKPTAALPLGGGAIGLIACGGGAVGLIACGGGAIGLIAIGGGALGYVAIGGGAVGVYVLAGDGAGRYVLSRNRQDREAIGLFCRYLPRLRAAFSEDPPNGTR